MNLKGAIPIRIILDLDEVVCDMMNPLITTHNDRFNSDITIDDITSWDLPIDMVEIFTEPAFFLDLPPIPGAIDGVKKLLEWGHDIVIATNHSDNNYIAADKVLWVQEHLPELAGNMMIGGRKDILQGDIIIDDNPDYLINSPCPIKICMDRPWNRSSEYEFPILTESGAFAEQWHRRMVVYRVNNWIQILSLIQTNFAYFDWRNVSGKQ